MSHDRELERLLWARAARSLGVLAILSGGAWWLFSSAQETAGISPLDHRHVDSWQIVTGVLLLGWIAALILEHNLLRDEKRAGGLRGP